MIEENLKMNGNKPYKDPKKVINPVPTLEPSWTSVEQSRELLSYGLPRLSADMYWGMEFTDPVTGKTKRDVCPRQARVHGNDLYKGRFGRLILPCWTTGRLINILEILTGRPYQDAKTIGQSTLLQRVMSCFKGLHSKGWLNFDEVKTLSLTQVFGEAE